MPDRSRQSSLAAIVEALIASLAADFEPAAQEKKQHLRIAVAPDARTLVVDSAKLHDILQKSRSRTRSTTRPTAVRSTYLPTSAMGAID